MAWDPTQLFFVLGWFFVLGLFSVLFGCALRAFSCTRMLFGLVVRVRYVGCAPKGNANVQVWLNLGSQAEEKHCLGFRASGNFRKILGFP
jgi:hypothetical protein